MEKTIKILDYCKMALSEVDGKKVRTIIENEIAESHTVVLDFSGINIFATPFFNSSIGYFIMKFSPEEYEMKIKVANLTKLGVDTYSHSKENAEEILKKKMDIKKIGIISEETLKNS